MRIGVSHLNGIERGKVETLAGPVLSLGSAHQCDLRVRGSGVRGHHATIELSDSEAFLHPIGEVRLNGRQVGEVELHNYDMLEIGHSRVRLRLLPGDTELPARPAVVQHRRHPLLAAIAAVVMLAAGVGLYAHGRDQGLSERIENESQWAEVRRRETVRRLEQLQSDFESLETRVAGRAEVDARMGEVQRAVAQVEDNVLSRVTTEIERTLDNDPGLKAARDAGRGFEKVLKRHAGAVCLVQGAYGFGRTKDGKFRFLREAEPAMLDDFDRDSKVPLMLDGKGPRFEVEFTGTGFLAGDGIVVTNRHLAQPWWKNDAARPLLADDFVPRFIYLRLYFPGRKGGIPCDPARAVISVKSDLAALRFDPPADPLPAHLELAKKSDLVAGRRVILLGYPSGLNALLARADGSVAGDSIEPLELLDALSARDLIRPLPTSGHISDVVGRKMLFDAPTAVGGSGAPLLDGRGRVLGVNYGILKSFSGANFAVPVDEVAALLARARK
ncbi:MAG: trypsin-like peptidase domain-containing protein [Planctomycetota bacterium]